jgi:hypothetical protein
MRYDCAVCALNASDVVEHVWAALEVGAFRALIDVGASGFSWIGFPLMDRRCSTASGAMPGSNGRACPGKVHSARTSLFDSRA